MKDVQEFKIDHWSSNVSALSLNDLRALSSDPSLELFDPDLKLDYGSFEGSQRLRERIAALHSTPECKLTADNVIITPGSIMANFLVLDAICGPGDHIVCQYPTFGQLYLVPKFNGVNVSLWKMDDSKEWMPSLEELERLVKPNTKAIILNNPNNPTGAVLSKDFLEKVITIARKSNTLVFTDEVFSPLFFTPDRPPSFVTMGYERSVVTSSLSKSFAIPGARIGWVVSRDEALLRRISMARDFTTISVSQLDDAVAAFALDEKVLPALMKRNIALCKESIEHLAAFVERNKDRVTWRKPDGAGTAFIKILDREGKPVDDVEFSQKLVDEESVCLLAGGRCFSEGNAEDFKGYVRIGLGDPKLVKDSLPLFEKFLRKS
ncbi:aspartate aminotransferase [Purpureocillium lavendulum]|uniref:Aspartate aminotransferase n=1 Tax=Purpureocillium lavendulum TaxID=1247861 RepID=A0AB34G2F0_9HYPO|nr:aspartate aminotransferase [Purpureocillium lavendulum]